MAQVTSSTNATLVKIKYEKRFLDFVQQELQFRKAAQLASYKIRPGEGKTIEWTQFLPKSLVTSALGEGVSTVVGATTGFTTQIKRATLEQWGDVDYVSDYLEFTSLDPRVMGLMELQGTQAGESIELETAKTWGKWGGLGVRADLDAASAFYNLACQSGTNATTVVGTSAINIASPAWVGAKVTITSGPGYGETRFVASHSTVTLTMDSAFETAPTTASTFSICGGVGAGTLAAGDKAESTAIRAGLKRLRMSLAKPIKSGYYMGILDPMTEADMLGDSTWTSLNTNHVSGPNNIFEGEVGKIWGISFVRSTMPFTTTAAAAGTYVADAIVHHMPLLGKNSLGVVEAAGQEETVILTPAKIADPALNMFSTVGWKVMWKAKNLNSSWSVDLMCVPTAG